MKRLTYTLEDSIVILKWVAGVMTVFVLFLILTGLNANRIATDKSNETGRENNTYLRTVACILSVPLGERTDDYISNCYLKAENKSGTNVDHFGNR